MDNDAQTTIKRRKRGKREILKKGKTTFRHTKTVALDKAEIVCISSYPPRECGIATFSHDLLRALQHQFGDSFNLTVCPLEMNSHKHSYDDGIEYTLNTDSELDFFSVAHRINDNSKIALVLIQHEFGLFKSNKAAFLEFLQVVNKPILLTFHTVLPEPDIELVERVQALAEFSSGVIAMTQTSKHILIKEYGLSEERVTVIAHGTHLVPFEDKNLLKKTYGYGGKTVLSTFGLLGPGKNIETTLRALPQIVEEHPEVVFLVIGKTHPSLVHDFGEDYRQFLESLVEQLHLQDHVEFINRFVPTPQLLEYLQLTDIYLFTTKDPNQAVSGTFAYALSCACPVVSTPIPHALEVLQNEAGVVFDFSDSNQLQQAVLDLLDRPELLETMSYNGLHTSAASAWENAALSHAKLFESLCGSDIKLRYRKPPVDLQHLKKMTTEVGIAQFCKINQPDMEYGYTLDDNARALITFCRHYTLTGDTNDLKYIKKYFDFVVCCYRPEGKFWNYVDENCHFTDQNGKVNLEDSNGRAIWALGYLLSISKHLPSGYETVQDRAIFLFQQSLENIVHIKSPRAMAFAIKGLYYFSLHKGCDTVGELMGIFADRLHRQFIENTSDDWQWFEPYLTYGNAVLPEAMLMAHSILGYNSYEKTAKTTFDFLINSIFTNDTIRVISNKKWLGKGETLDRSFQGGEQPIDVAYTILALDHFENEFPEEAYGSLKQKAFSWFLGNNALHQTMYNPCTGGCYDGIELNNVNLNQGAESTLSYHLARMTFPIKTQS